MREMFSSWLRVITHPNEETMAQELANPKASVRTAVRWLLIGNLLFSVIYVISSYFFELIHISGSRLPTIIGLFLITKGFTTSTGFHYGIIFGSPLARGIYWLLINSLLLTIGSLVCWGLARALGGKGALSQQTCLLATFVPPILMVGGFLHGLLSWLLWAYGFMLAFFMVKQVYKLPTLKAGIAVFIPCVILLVPTYIIQLL